MKLAARERPVALIVGDGSFLYSPILQGLGASQEHALPITIVVLNNRGYVQMGRSHLYHYPDGAAANSEHFFGVHIEGPNYGQLAEALKLTGSRVDRTSDLISVFRRARERVSAGETSIVDVQMVK